MKEDKDEHIMDEIIENMASKLYFHGHAINRVEARDELKLKVLSELPAGLESLIFTKIMRKNLRTTFLIIPSASYWPWL